MLRNVIALVSGGSSGLGAATVATVIRHGGRVVVADLPSSQTNYFRLAAFACAEASRFKFDQHQLPTETVIYEQQKTPDAYSVHELAPDAPIIAFSPVDVRSENDVSKALDLAEELFGEPVNVAVNCAGIAPAQKILKQLPSMDPTGTCSFRVHSLDDFKRCLEVNTVGTFNVVRLAAERMSKRKTDTQGLRGCIINTASIAAFDGQIGQVSYAASKSAIVGMTLPLARELAPLGIRVMTIAPGLFNTPLLESLPESVRLDLAKSVPCPSRLGNPDEFANLVVSILTNSMLNGTVIRLDGALRMPPK